MGSTQSHAHTYRKRRCFKTTHNIQFILRSAIEAKHYDPPRCDDVKMATILHDRNRHDGNACAYNMRCECVVLYGFGIFASFFAMPFFICMLRALNSAREFIFSNYMYSSNVILFRYLCVCVRVCLCE